MRLTLTTIAILALAASACAPTDDPQRATTSALIANRNLDILFMIDDSTSMRPSQTNLLNNFPAFMDVLKSLPGGLPNIHVAVISANTGVGTDDIQQCSSAGDQGIFKYTPRGTCTASPLNPGATYLSNVGGQANYTGDISAAFSCIAALGDTGCGFERQFDSIVRALGADGLSPPAENAGFLRPDALLAIVMVTNEDDCTARAGTNLYEPLVNTLVASTFGPVSSFRCNEFGHVCNGVRPPRLAPNGDVAAQVMLQNCTSSECDGSLMPVAEFVARIKSLKTAPASEILLAAITGPPTPYTVTWRAPLIADSSCGSATCPWPAIAHSCTAVDQSFGDPAVRISEAVSAFGVNGFLSSICETNFGPALQQIANRIGSLLSAGGGTGGPPGSIPSCTTTGVAGRGGGGNSGGGGSTGSGSGGSSGPGSGGSGGTTEGGDASVDGGKLPPRDGCGCQTGGVAANGWGVALVITAWLACRRRRGDRGAALSRSR
jgi:hypothetical protein